MRYIPTPTNFIAPEIKPEDYSFGKIGGVPLREDGDWRPYLPQLEKQNIRGIETSACATFHTIRPIAVLQEETYELHDQNYSERFISQLSGTTPVGNSPSKVAQTIRDFGLIADELLPFSDDIQSWEEYNSFKGGSKSKCLSEGKKWKAEWEFRYEWVFTSGTPKDKTAKLREALKYSPVGVSVSAWYEDNGLYVKPSGSTDNHWCSLVYIDEDGHPYISDTYEPFLKKLEKNYDFGFAMRYAVTQKEAKRRWWFVEIFLNLWGLLKSV